MMKEENHYSLEHPSPALPPLRDLLSDCLHADVRRELAFASWGVYGGWEGGKEKWMWLSWPCVSLLTQLLIRTIVMWSSFPCVLLTYKS